ncbi:Uncharacterized conserved protein [Commensalibacter communis]|uniref:YiaAB domain (YiaAB) n=1 Tax=Commensalibacter communis TaxID=2972786 RepID=A0A9W4TP51_9PROT|nr:Uncharacterized conserved protein [Commensalibacter communis]CAI3941269.1 Uncharacterized conserved protein [Commensalibacter communis]CAI3944432.1 Uncharacterized conserved protein [Commensalibacter communis]CAI3945395.1 Uncharacterized conserved protein [Commensalibacter communis]CAI3945456.1 Uncharacterized conserved protein [Commensalibacter communis]
MNNVQYINKDSKLSKQSNTTTSSWVLFTWVSFIISIVAMAFAVIYMPMDNWLRAYLGLASLFLVQSSISLSKTLRDQAEYQSEPTE